MRASDRRPRRCAHVLRLLSALLLLALLLPPPPPAAAGSWREQAQAATLSYVQKQLADTIEEKLRQQLVAQLNKLAQMRGLSNAYVNSLAGVALGGPALREVAEGLASNDPDKVRQAQEGLALEFGKVIWTVARPGARGEEALGALIENAGEIKEVAGTLGAAAGGDVRPALQLLGSKLLALTPLGQVVEFYQAAYGVMAWAKDRFVDASVEDLYQQYREGKLSEEGLRNALEVGGYNFLVRDRTSEMRSRLEEEIDRAGVASDKLRAYLLDIQQGPVVDDIIATFRARRQKEADDAANATLRAEAEQRAQVILGELEQALRDHYGDNWEETISFDPAALARFIASVEQLMRSRGLTAELAARIQAAKLVYGKDSPQYREEAVKWLGTRTTGLRACAGLACLKSSRDAVLERAAILGAEGEIAAPGAIALPGGSFQEHGVDQPCDPDIQVGPFAVAAGGRLRATIRGEPPVPMTWSLFNANTSMTVIFAPRLGVGYGPGERILSLGGEGDNHILSGEAEWPSAGQLTFVFGAPRGAGPLSGSCFGQSFTATAEVLELKPAGPAIAGGELRSGDQVRTGSGGEAILLMPDGSTLIVRANSAVSFTESLPGVVRVTLTKGSVRLVRAPSGEHTLELQIGNRLVTPRGTDVLIAQEGETGSVMVFEGEVAVAEEGGAEQAVTAGQRLALPEGAVSAIEAPASPPDPSAIEAPADLPLDDSTPWPYGEVTGDFAGGEVGEGWTWLDPGNDATLETPEDGVLRVTVPDGNDLWREQDTAPRLLHKVTGDFDLEGELLLVSQGTDLATGEFMVFSPGSYLGYLNGQMAREGMVAHALRFMSYYGGDGFGAGWFQRAGLRRLPLLNQRLSEGVEPPDWPVRVRLSRRGDLWHTAWSLDGVRWNLASRQRILAPDTLWVGWLFTRMAYDRLADEPAVITLRAVRLTSAPRDTLPAPAWEMVQSAGTVSVDGATLALELDGSRLGRVMAQMGAPIEADFDAVVRFKADDWEAAPGLSRSFSFFATAGTPALDPDEYTYAYVGQYQRDDGPRRYQTDLRLNGGWYHGYQERESAESTGWLRLNRRDGKITSYIWSHCRWLPIDKGFDVGIKDPVFLGVRIANDAGAKQPAPLYVEFTLEQVLAPPAGPADTWQPERCSVVQEGPAPASLQAPPGIPARLYQAPFKLGTLFFASDGTAYVFSSTREQRVLLRLAPSGEARIAIESDALAGANFKAGAALDSSVLLTVDYYPEGGNALGGLYQLEADGTYHEWKLARGHGGAADLIPAPGGGWYFADFENDNIWFVPAEGGEEQPLLSGEVPPGLALLAYDPASSALYAVNWGGSWPFGGTGGLYRVDRDGKATLIVPSGEGTNFTGLAASPGGPFGPGLFVSDPAAGAILKVSPDGTTVPAVLGLPNPGALRFDPTTGDLLVVLDGTALLRLGDSRPLPAATAIVPAPSATLPSASPAETMATPLPGARPPSSPPPSGPAAAAAAGALGPAVFDNWNDDGVANNPPLPTRFTLDRPARVVRIVTYHWNEGRGTPAPGTLALMAANGRSYGPWPAVGRPGVNGEPNAIWEVRPNVDLPAGEYTVVDSDRATWSQNAASQLQGIARVEVAGELPPTRATLPPPVATTPLPPPAATPAPVAALVDAWGTVDADSHSFAADGRVQICWELADLTPSDATPPAAQLSVYPQGASGDAFLVRFEAQGNDCAVATLPSGSYYVAVHASAGTRWHLIVRQG